MTAMEMDRGQRRWALRFRHNLTKTHRQNSARADRSKLPQHNWGSMSPFANQRGLAMRFLIALIFDDHNRGCGSKFDDRQPRWRAADSSGATSAGKWTLVMVCSTVCRMCQAEIPSVNGYHEANDNGRIRVLNTHQTLAINAASSTGASSIG